MYQCVNFALDLERILPETWAGELSLVHQSQPKKVDEFNSEFLHHLTSCIRKTRTKGVHKNVSQGCLKIN